MSQDFSLTANCDSDIGTVTFTFAGTGQSGHPSLFHNAGSAAGIALTLGSVIGGTEAPIHANNASSLIRNIAPVSGVATLPLRARYWKFGPTQTKGTLLSNLTVTITHN